MLVGGLGHRGTAMEYMYVALVGMDGLVSLSR